MLSYQPDTGRLVWLERSSNHIKNDVVRRRWNTRYAGTEAFSAVSNRGYKHGRLLNQSLTAHRVAWALYYGKWPVGEIDDINGNRADNRIENLRDVTPSQNRQNAAMSWRNSSGVSGVSWHSVANKWRAEIKANGQRVYLGVFATMDAAIDARKKAEREFEFHPNHGRALGLVRK